MHRFVFPGSYRLLFRFATTPSKPCSRALCTMASAEVSKYSTMRTRGDWNLTLDFKISQMVLHRPIECTPVNQEWTRCEDVNPSRISRR
jgi:hypothetical protein